MEHSLRRPDRTNVGAPWYLGAAAARAQGRCQDAHWETRLVELGQLQGADCQALSRLMLPSSACDIQQGLETGVFINLVLHLILNLKSSVKKDRFPRREPQKG